jgi:hypothetical protein
MAGKALKSTRDLTANGEIKGMDVVTQAEYDALTTEEQNDGTIRFIQG